VITVVVVDDERLVRSGFEALLSSDPGIEVVGTASSGDEALEVVRRTQPTVVLMDIRMPGGDGLRATAAITSDARLAATRVIVLTTFDLDEYVHAALESGASGFLLKDALPEDLLRAVHAVAAGDAAVAPAVLRRLMDAYVQAPVEVEAPAWVGTLTPREGEVLMAVGRGLSNAEIGAELYISAATAKTHVSRLLAKLELRDRTQLAIAARQAEGAIGDVN